MEIIRLLIIVNDKEYGNALGKAISNLHNDFQVTIGQNEKYFKDDLINYDLILIEGCIQNEIYTEVNSFNKIIFLLENKVETLDIQISNLENKKSLEMYKYNKVSELVADLRYLYSLITGKKNIRQIGNKSIILGFFSASGGTGKSAISISTARELSRYHDKKVLFLSFEEITSISLYMRCEHRNRNICDFLYYIFNKNSSNSSNLIEGFIYSDDYKVDTFYPSIGCNDLKRLNTDELAIFFNSILYSKSYDYILLDLSNDVTDETIYLLSFCNNVIFVKDNSYVSEYKSNKLISYLNRFIGSESTKNFIWVINKINVIQDFEDKPKKSFAQNRNYIEIESDNNSFVYKDKYLDVSINHVFGLGIKKIVDEILLISK